MLNIIIKIQLIIDISILPFLMVFNSKHDRKASGYMLP